MPAASVARGWRPTLTRRPAVTRGAALTTGPLQDVERAVEVDLDLAPIGFRHGRLKARAGQVRRDGTRGATADRLDRGGLRLRGCRAGHGLLGVLVSGRAMRWAVERPRAPRVRRVL